MPTRLKPFIESRFPRLFSLLADIHDRRAMRDGEPELRLLPRLVTSGETVCDVGANRGLYTYWLLRLGVRVFAFEPNPRLVRIMNLRFRRAIAGGRLTVGAVAPSDEAGTTVLHVPTHAAALGTMEDAAFARMGDVATEMFSVTRVRLDDVVTAPVDFLKIDVEGHETAVIRGALGLIGRDRPSLLVEAEERHHPGAVAAIRGLLEPLGYRGYFFDGAVLHPIESFEAAVHQDLAALNAEGTGHLPGRVYYNNFVFIARDAVRARLADLTVPA